MSNNYFQFKQFKISQDKATMKVGTDAVLLGAWVNVSYAKNVLDIGTGTGIIALMIAQRCPECYIDALEIEPSAVEQAIQNVENSEWKHKIKITNIDFLKFQTSKRYDLIVSNPPFFQQGLKSENVSKNIARHAITLDYASLIEKSAQLLSKKGILALVFPAEYYQEIVRLSAYKLLYPIQTMYLKTTPTSKPKRVLVALSRKAKFHKQDTIVIENSRHNYSDDFINLTKEFYLKF